MDQNRDQNMDNIVDDCRFGSTPAEDLGIEDSSKYEIKYIDERKDKSSSRYYELLIDADEEEPPIIWVEKYDTLEEVRDKPGCLACGGVAFVLFRVRDGKKEIVANYCTGYDEDGWIDDGVLEWETEEFDRKWTLKKLAEEAMLRHPEYIQQKLEEKRKQEMEDELKCDALIAQIQSNLLLTKRRR